jgi:hypothetical protein
MHGEHHRSANEQKEYVCAWLSHWHETLPFKAPQSGPTVGIRGQLYKIRAKVFGCDLSRWQIRSCF